MLKLIDTGDWGHSAFEAYLDLDGNFDQYRSTATGAICICFDKENKVVLMNNQPIGGKLEKGETVEDALQREALEEVGFKLNEWKYFGHYKVTLRDTAPQKYMDKYPPIGYIIFFLATGEKVCEPYGEEATETQLMTVDEVLNSNEITHKMLKEGLKLYPQYPEN